MSGQSNEFRLVSPFPFGYTLISQTEPRENHVLQCSAPCLVFRPGRSVAVGVGGGHARRAAGARAVPLVQAGGREAGARGPEAESEIRLREVVEGGGGRDRPSEG